VGSNLLTLNISCGCGLPKSITDIAGSTSNQYVSRNVQQFRHKRISQDPLSNVHSIAYNLIWKMQTYPDLVIVCGAKEVFEELQIVLLLKDKTLLLSYVEPISFLTHAI